MNGCHVKPEQFFNLIPGFESIVEEQVANLSLAAGTNTLDGTAVPTGKVWRITQASMVYIGTVPTRITLSVPGLAADLVLLTQASPGSNVHYSWSGEVFMQDGDKMRVTVEGATLNDDLYLRYAGLQMAISQ